mgnify:FL=1|tara:strand:- start:364 stop:795 length:432 start_codon:yes stop_codon:yes gene_type:complete
MPRVDDRRVLSGIIFINRNGLRWRDAPREYGPRKTFYNRRKRWSNMGVFARIMTALAAEVPDHKTIAIDTTHLKAHRTTSSLGAKKGARSSDRTNKGRDEFQAARSHRRGWRPAADVPHGRSLDAFFCGNFGDHAKILLDDAI